MMIWNLYLLYSVTGLLSGVLPIPEERMTSFLYGTVRLPCTFPFVEASAGLTVVWVKDEYRSKVIVYKLLSGEESPEEQDPRYRGRVKLSKEFPQGNLNLTLTNVTYKDEGTYFCRAANLRDHGNKKVTLSIDKLNAVEPTVTLVTVDDKRCMKCRGAGLYHAPEIQWITTLGEDLSRYGKHNITKQSDGWMFVESVLHYNVDNNVQVLCHIKEGRLKRSARAIISDGTNVVIVDNNSLASKKEQRTSAMENSGKSRGEIQYEDLPKAEYLHSDSWDALGHRADGILLLVTCIHLLSAQSTA